MLNKNRMSSYLFFHGQQPAFRRLMKIISLITTFSFVLPNLTWAFEKNSFATSKNLVFNQPIVDLPARLGSVVQTFQGNSDRLVIYIQDLHCNENVQRHIASVVDELARHQGLKIVGVEGAAGIIHLQKLSAFPVPAVRQMVADYFLKLGRITGPEWYAASQNPDLQLFGVENARNYQSNWQTVKRFLNDESQGYLYDLKEALNGLKKSIYNPALYAHDQQRMDFQEGRKSLLTFAVYLFRSGREAGWDLGNYPNLSKYVSLRLNVFPQNLDSDQLFSEMEALEVQVRERLYRRDEERRLDHGLKVLETMERLLNISASTRDLAEYRQHPEQYRVEPICDFLRVHDPQGEITPDPEVLKLNEYLEDTRAFYQVADRRSLDFVDNLLGQMNLQQQHLAVLITGGYHSEMVMSELRKRNISYLAFKPRLDQLDWVNPYFSILREKQAPLEKLLAQNQNILAPPTEFTNPILASELNAGWMKRIGNF